MNFTIYNAETAASTNDFLRNEAENGQLPEGYVIAANSQTSGRGQRGAVWESEPGANITMSLLLRPCCIGADHMFLVSKVVALGICEFLEQYGKPFSIKWPNDIYFEDKKICGVLIENQLMGSNILYSIVGIGLNVNQKKFFGDAPNPISMCHVYNRAFDRQEVLNGLLSAIDKWYQVLAGGNYGIVDNAYLGKLYHSKGTYTFRTPGGDSFSGNVELVEPNGRLTIRTTDGRALRFWFKEVQFG